MDLLSDPDDARNSCAVPEYRTLSSLTKRYIAAASFLISLCSAAAAAAPTYRVIDIGFLPAADTMNPGGLNNHSVVVGTAYLRPFGIRAFVWTEATGVRKLPVPPDGRGVNSNAHDVNDSKQVIGYVPSGPSEGDEAIWNPNGTYTYYLDGTWASDSAPYSIVQITNGGKVLGQSYWKGVDGIFYPWIWSPERGLIDISHTGRDGFVAYQMNDRGRVVGSNSNCFTSITAVVYDVDEARLRWIDPAHGSGCFSSNATAVNDHGDVVGWARTGGIPDLRPFVWNETDGYRVLPGSVARNRDEMRPTDINNAKQVVGRFNLANQRLRTSFFYWDEENGFHDIKKLLDPDDPMTAEVVLNGEQLVFDAILVPKINDRGEILVTGSLRGEDVQDGPKHTFLLVPVKSKK
jgi:uncharacterized membrane protein